MTGEGPLSGGAKWGEKGAVCCSAPSFRVYFEVKLFTPIRFNRASVALMALFNRFLTDIRRINYLYEVLLRRKDRTSFALRMVLRYDPVKFFKIR